MNWIDILKAGPAAVRIIRAVADALELAGPNGRKVSPDEWREIADGALDAFEVLLGSLFVHRIG